MKNHLKKYLVSVVFTTIISSALLVQAATSPPSSYIAHEWGTFTSLEDSEGNTVEGMYHEDEVLPSFVYGRGSALALQTEGPKSPTLTRLSNDPDPAPSSRPPCRGKCLDFSVVPGTEMTVTQKMETPVIYFYSQTSQAVKIDVDFPGGIISQYFPNPTDFSPPLGKVGAVSKGHVHWDIDISDKILSVPKIDSGSIWGPSRKTHSNFISAHGENEKFIFYRGLGNFTTSLQVLDDKEGGLQIQNHSDQTVPDAFVLRVNSNGAQVRKLGEVHAQGQLSVSRSDLAQMQSGALDLIEQALERSGLYPDESQAMVHTWEKSYFKTPGLRVLYIVPREWTDHLLPLTLSPQPDQLVRTLVGRVEIMTAGEEQTLLGDLKKSFQKSSTSDSIVQTLGRFGESKLRRILQLAQKQGESSSFLKYLEKLVNKSAAQ